MIPKIAAMLRIKNEARWLEEVLASVRPICSDTFVFDDNSTDETVAIAQRAGADVIRSTHKTLDESRDKNELLARVLESKPDWILCIDGDEVLEPTGPAKIIQHIVGAPHAWAFTLKIVYLWDDPDHVRVDGIYGNFRRPSLFRVTDARSGLMKFRTTDGAANFHCSNAPEFHIQNSSPADVRLKHYGYIERAMRLAKYDWYNRHDPDNAAEDRYRHMVQGDVPEVPADAVLKHAGPLKIAPWS
jgi:glycosyltransferase involved in cell wall biosynthesis